MREHFEYQIHCLKAGLETIKGEKTKKNKVYYYIEDEEQWLKNGGSFRAESELKTVSIKDIDKLEEKFEFVMMKGFPVLRRKSKLHIESAKRYFDAVKLYDLTMKAVGEVIVRYEQPAKSKKGKRK